MSLRKVLISGGTGFVGRRLLEHLCDAGFHPVALARQSSDTVEIGRFLDRPVFGDDVVRVAELLEPSTLSSVCKDIDAVVHLAADMDFFPSEPNRLVRVNVEGTRNLLRACAGEARARGIRLPFVYLSSTEAIGPTDPGGKRATEDAAFAPDCDYGRSKGMAEVVALSGEFAESLHVCVLRLTGVYGPSENFFFREMISMIEAGLLFVSPGPMSGKVMFSHVDDVCRATLLSLQGLLSGQRVSAVYNVCPNDAVEYRELVDTIAVAVNRSPPIMEVPLSVATLAMGILGPLLNLGKRRVFMCHPDSLRKTTSTRVYSNELIKRELGYAPVPDTHAAVRQLIEGEVAAGRIQITPVSPLVLNFTKVLSLVLFGAARLWISSQESLGSPMKR